MPVKAVAAFMQKDPQVLIAHPDVGINSLADMKGHPILLSDASITAFWPWLKAKYGFTDDQVRSYDFNNGPFILDKQRRAGGLSDLRALHDREGRPASRPRSSCSPTRATRATRRWCWRPTS